MERVDDDESAIGDHLNEISDLRGSLGDCHVEHRSFLLAAGLEPFHDLQVSVAPQMAWDRIGS